MPTKLMFYPSKLRFTEVLRLAPQPLRDDTEIVLNAVSRVVATGVYFRSLEKVYDIVMVAV